MELVREVVRRGTPLAATLSRLPKQLAETTPIEHRRCRKPDCVRDHCPLDVMIQRIVPRQRRGAVHLLFGT